MELDKRAYITEAETLALIRYVQVSEADVVEIGTFHGGTTVNIAEHLRPSVALWTIDLFEGYFVPNVNPVPIYREVAAYERIFVLIGNSNHIGRYWRNDIGVLFIDGCHKYDIVSTDFNLWSQWVIPGGVIAMHDAKAGGGLMSLCQGMVGESACGVAVLAKEVQAEGKWKVVEEVDSMLFFVRSDSV